MYYRATIAPDDCTWIIHQDQNEITKNRVRTNSLKSVLKSKQPGEHHPDPRDFPRDFYVWLWCWHDFHRDKKFSVPLIAREQPDSGKVFPDTPERQFSFWGGKHRQEVVWLYNQIFDTDYKLDAVVPGAGPGEPYYDIEWHKWDGKYTDRTIDYPAIKGHKTAITKHADHEGIQVRPFKKMFDQYPNGIIFDGATRSMLNNVLGEDLFMPGAQNVWVKLGKMFWSGSKAVVQLRLVALICCILCKIPVNSPYFTLKFQE